VQYYFRRNNDPQQFGNDKQNADVAPPPEKFLRTHMNDCAFSLSFSRAFTHYELFVSFRPLNFGCKINTVNPLLVINSSKLPAITNVIHKLLWVLRTIPNDN